MKENWIKINDEIFYIREVVIQLSVMSHAIIDISFDIKKYKQYSDIFFNKYEIGKKFDIVGKEFEGRGIFIKAIDVGQNIMNVSLKCDYLDHKDISDRRDEAIDVVLHKDKS